MIRWTLSRSTNSCVFVLAPAGLPPVSAMMSSTFRPAMVLLRSLRKSWMPSSICLPPAASGPVRTVRKPMRIGPDCASTGWDRASAAAQASEYSTEDLLRIGCSFVPGLQFFEGVDVGERLRLVVERDLDDVERSVPGVDLASAFLEEIGEVVEHAAAHEGE